MTSPKSKVLKMVADGKIKPEDGEELMGAMGHKRKFSWRSLLNPFDRMPDMPGLVVFLLLVIAHKTDELAVAIVSFWK